MCDPTTEHSRSACECGCKAGLRVQPRMSAERRGLLRASLLIGAAAWLPSIGRSETQVSTLNERMSGDFAPVHDPCIIKAGDTYHLFCTGHASDATGLIPWRT